MRVMAKIWWVDDPVDCTTWEVLAIAEPEADDDEEVFASYETAEELFDSIARNTPEQPWMILDLDDWDFDERQQ